MSWEEEEPGTEWNLDAMAQSLATYLNMSFGWHVVIEDWFDADEANAVQYAAVGGEENAVMG